ncbi:MAG: hypothetical protein ACTSW1_08290 [Candidatus Hodarchaeales archaeon]
MAGKTGNVIQTEEDQNISDLQFNGLTAELGGNPLIGHNPTTGAREDSDIGDDTSGTIGHLVEDLKVRTGKSLKIYDASGNLVTTVPWAVFGGVDTFETNFSIDQKEGVESTQYDNQQMFQRIGFGSKFDSLVSDSEFLHRLENVLVPATSHEVTYVGTWSNLTTASVKFGDRRATSTADDTATFGFTGVSVSVAMNFYTGMASIYSEISSDAGATWSQRKAITPDVDSGDVFNVIFELYSGLEYGDYEVRLTAVASATYAMIINYFSYTTYMVQKSVDQYALLSGGPSDIDDVPSTTSLLSGTWAVDVAGSTVWNNIRHSSATTASYIEMKFYGDAIWASLQWVSTADRDIDVLIDGVTTSVKAAVINTLAPTNDQSSKVRLDDGTLTDGEHTVRLTVSATGAGTIFISGWGWHSSSQDSTVCNDLIIGDSSYAVGIDDAGFSFSGGGWAAVGDTAGAFLRRTKNTTANTDYAEYTTQNNADLKAVYGIWSRGTDHGEIKIQIAGGTDRYINSDTNNYTKYNGIYQLYDSEIDGITLHNKVLRITKVDGTNMRLEGLIFEVWGADKVGADHITVMPKWTKYNTTDVSTAAVSNSYRFSINGSGKTGRDRNPVIHTGYLYSAAGADMYFQHGSGVNPSEVVFNVLAKSVPTNNDVSSRVEQDILTLNSIGDPGLGFLTVAGAANLFFKIIMNLPRAI